MMQRTNMNLDNKHVFLLVQVTFLSWFIAPKEFLYIMLSNILTMNILDEETRRVH